MSFSATAAVVPEPTKKSAIKSFSFERVSKPGAVFDTQKLNSFNSHYIKNYNTEKLQDLLSPFFEEPSKYTKAMIDLVKDKVDNLGDFEGALEFVFQDSISLNKSDLEYVNSENCQFILKNFIKYFNKNNEENNFQINNIIKEVQKNTDSSPKDIWKTIRIVLTGHHHGPSLNEIIKIYGPEKTNTLLNSYVTK